MREYDEVWAVEGKRIKAFFAGHEENVTVIPLPARKLGTVEIPQTRIIIRGEDAEELYHQFFMHFMTAGG